MRWMPPGATLTTEGWELEIKIPSLLSPTVSQRPPAGHTDPHLPTQSYLLINTLGTQLPSSSFSPPQTCLLVSPPINLLFASLLRVGSLGSKAKTARGGRAEPSLHVCEDGELQRDVRPVRGGGSPTNSEEA